MNDQSTDLIVLPPRETALEVFSGEFDAMIAPLLVGIQAAVESFKADASTEEGRKAIASFDYRLARSKTALDAAGKAIVDGLKELPKRIDANRRRARLQIEAWQRDIRAPLDEWVAVDNARREIHLDTIRLIQQIGLVPARSDSDTIRQKIAEVEHVAIGPQLEEFEEEGRVAREAALGNLRTALAEREAWEAQEAENARLRAIVAEQEAAAKKAREEQEKLRAAAERAQREADLAQALARNMEIATREIDEEMKRREKADQEAAERRKREEAEAKAQREFEEEQRRGRIERARIEAGFDIIQVLENAKVAKSRLGPAADALLSAIMGGGVRFVRFEP